MALIADIWHYLTSPIQISPLLEIDHFFLENLSVLILREPQDSGFLEFSIILLHK
jgi:hypothetical protein